MRAHKAAGFTLLELIVVVGVVSGLLVLALVFMHPKDMGPAERNAQRQLDTAHLMQVLIRYARDHGGLPKGITDKARVLGTQQGELNLCQSFVPAYLENMPTDPVSGGFLTFGGKVCTDENVFYSTGYTIQQSGAKVTIAAPDAEARQSIAVSRTF